MKLVIGAIDDFVDAISVPGATTSGLIRRSVHGPRLLNAASAFAFPQTISTAIGLLRKKLGQSIPNVFAALGPSVRSLRLAPTVIAFFDDAGAAIESQSG